MIIFGINFRVGPINSIRNKFEVGSGSGSGKFIQISIHFVLFMATTHTHNVIQRIINSCFLKSKKNKHHLSQSIRAVQLVLWFIYYILYFRTKTLAPIAQSRNVIPIILFYCYFFLFCDKNEYLYYYSTFINLHIFFLLLR